MKARRNTTCNYCGSGIRRGEKIARATFELKATNYRETYQRRVTEWTHERCAYHAKREWPELQKERIGSR